MIKEDFESVLLPEDSGKQSPIMQIIKKSWLQLWLKISVCSC